MQLAPQLTADVAPSAAAHRACLSCSPKSDSPSLLYSSAILVVPVCSSSIDPRLSSRPSSHATISAVPLHGCLHRRAIPAAAASADDRRPLGVAAQAQAGILHGHGRRRRLAREDAAAGRGPGGAHLAASPQHVSYISSLSAGHALLSKTARKKEEIQSLVMCRYGSRATARDFEIYAPDATFEDPLMRAHGCVHHRSPRS